MGHTWDKGPHRRGDPEAMLAYLRHQAQTDPVMAHAVAFIDHDRAELADYRASTAETLALHRRIHDDLRADVARMSNRCTFLEGALRRLLDGRTLTAEEESFARRLLDNRPGVDATGRQDQPEHPNAYVTTWRPAPAPDDVLALCDEVDRLRAENAELAAALEDIAGMLPTSNTSNNHEVWVATAECSNMGTRCCWEYLGQPDGGPDEWCPVCVAEVAWSAWKMGVLR